VRIDADLREHYRSVASFTGAILALCGLITVSPLVLLAWHPEEARLAHGFLLPAALLLVVGGGVWRALRPRRQPVLTVQDGGVIVLLSWVVVTVVSALTFMIIMGLGFLPAFFESVSAWTTTGLSVIDVESAPRVVLLWRSIMQLAGGAGMAILLVTLAGGPLGPGLALAEGRGDQLVPHVRRSAKLVLWLYAGYALAGSIALRVAGMSNFDAVNHAFCAVSTGGFSTRAASIGHWDSPAIEAVTLPLMVLGSTNFQTAYLVFRRRFGAAARSTEVRTGGLLVAVAAILLFALVTAPGYEGLGKQARVAVFEAVSALTTTGYSTTSYGSWPAMGILLLVPLMIVGGGTGCTAGAMKQHRAHLLARAVVWELKRLWLPGRAVVDTSVWRRESQVSVTDRELVQVAVFAVAYLAILATGCGVLVACGFGFQEALFEYASSLGTVGLSVGVTSASAPAPVLWAEIFGMFLGRLEIFVVLVAVRKLFVDGAAAIKSRTSSAFATGSRGRSQDDARSRPARG
jgi:trk system potassium uptake protein TrkH